MAQIVLESAWQWCRLWWGDGRWTAIEDRRREDLDEQEVDRRFGAEAFARRASLQESGAHTHDPQSAPLLAVSVTASLVKSGWTIDVDTASRCTARRDAMRFDIAIATSRTLDVALEGAEGDVRARVSDLGGLERLIEGIGDDTDDVTARLYALAESDRT